MIHGGFAAILELDLILIHGYFGAGFVPDLLLFLELICCRFEDDLI